MSCRVCQRAENARELIAASGFDGNVKTIAVMRAYATRHGAGPWLTMPETGATA